MPAKPAKSPAPSKSPEAPGRSAQRADRRRYAPADLTALAYAVLCAALLIWALVVTATDTTDESMAAVIPLLATAPTSFVFLALPEGPAYFIAAIIAGALINAAIIRWCGHKLSRRPNKPH